MRLGCFCYDFCKRGSRGAAAGSELVDVLSDIGDTRYWRAEWPADPAADYGSLNAIARNKVNLARIVEHWPDMLRLAGSLVTHQVRAYDVAADARPGRPTDPARCGTEYGRIAKTLHLLAMIDPVDDTHRSRLR